jgi:hypothetical protein
MPRYKCIALAMLFMIASLIQTGIDPNLCSDVCLGESFNCPGVVVHSLGLFFLRFVS